MDYRVLFAAPLAALVMSVSATESSLPSPWVAMPLGIAAPDVTVDWTKVDWTKGPPRIYDIGLDPAAEVQGERSLSIKSLVKLEPSLANFALAQQRAQGYAGKRLRFSGQIRSEGVSIWAGLFMDEDPTLTTLIRLQGGLEGDENTLPFRGAAGQAPYKVWQDVSVVVQLPTTSDSVTLGLALVGEGQVWARKLRFEVVGPEVPLTSTRMLGFNWAKARDDRVSNQKSVASWMPPRPLQNPSFD
jgi:hypothetical protein